MSRKQPRSLHGRGRRGHGRRSRHRPRTLSCARRARARGWRSGTSTRGRGGGRLGELGGLGLRVDVTDRPGFTAFLDEVERRLGPIDVIVNNAGIMPVTRLEDEDERSITRQLEINLHAVIHGTREAVRRMRPRGTGHIVNIASIAGAAAFRTWRPTARPSTASSASRRPCATSCAARASRSRS